MLKAQKLRRRNNWEAKHSGNFEVIFPSTEFKPEDYQKFQDAAHEVYEDFNNRGQAAKRRQEKENEEAAKNLLKRPSET